MPRIYLSPSTQEGNFYVNGGTEEQYMNLVADQVVPYLRSSGIAYTRNTPDMTAASSIRQANAGNYDLYVALHSNAAPESRYGTIRGTDVYYYPYSRSGRRAADLFVANFRRIYPDPARVRAVSTTTIGEVSRTRAPAVLVEVAYHDNVQDANWIKQNIPNIAWAVALSIAQFLGVPLAQPQAPQTGTVTLSWGRLNIRSRPNTGATIVTTAPNGAAITVLGDAGNGWYVVQYQGTTGYAAAQYITL